MAKLYSNCFTESNIRKAIKAVCSKKSSKIAGPDGITQNTAISETKLIKEVKKRLRRCASVNSKEMLINNRKCVILNFYDRIAQQAVYQMIYPVLDKNMSKNSYGFRTGINIKIPVSKICSKIARSKEIFAIKVDIKKCFDSIPLDDAITMLRELGVNDAKLLSTIKHLMWVSKKYNGIGLAQGTILGPILSNCYLHKIDKWVEDNIQKPDTNFARSLKTHPHDLREWRESKGMGPTGKYYRYVDDFVILTNSRTEQVWIYTLLTDFLRTSLKININDDKTCLTHNVVIFLGFKIKKFRINNKTYTGIIPADIQNLKQKLKKLKWRSPEDIRQSLKKFVGILNYYDICNNFDQIMNYVGIKLLKVASRKQTALKRIKGHCVYMYNLNGKEYSIDIYSLRKNSKVSYKEYLVNSSWLTKREQLTALGDHFQTHNIYKWALWTRQKGKDEITGNDLLIVGLDIHHINGNHNDNRIENMLLTTAVNHRLIHSIKPTKNKKILKYRKALIK